MARNSAPSNIDPARTRERIAGFLSRMPGLPFEQAAEDLLATLGYRSDRTLQDQSGRPSDFAAEFPADNPGTKSEQDFLEHAASARLVFQLSDSEIRASASQQGVLLETGDFDRGHSRSFFFTAVELKGSGHSRTKYVSFTREINKRFLAPTVVLFRTADGLLSLAFAHRRGHKRDSGRDVLGKVSLVREIDLANTHRAHLDILAELSLASRVGWMDDHAKQRDFDGLLAAWLDTLDTQELNKRFYRELFAWFERAVGDAKFPTGEATVLDSEEHVIRLITRLLFVWFMKEKGLVSGDLFVEEKMPGLLRGYDRESGDSYYRAVLQNLFFATLNTERHMRGFTSGRQTTHRDFSRYRYKKEMSDPGALLDLFDRTPFINGGLFDCLDSEEATGDGGYRIDCFSDVHYGKLSIPNRLFFGDGGLITLFERYKFTVEENTPAEQEVALDPELLGSVFENLLAAYNPETRETARKQTGSYYTPRPVVDYMVDEALVEALAGKVRPTPRPGPTDDEKFWCERLRYLLDYEDAFDDAKKLFDDAETNGLVKAISEIRVLDPAVGSGAFPMGVLHKLTLALGRLDPENRRWRELQKELAGQRATAAFDTRDQQERDLELTEISEIFERYRDDFGRKLYLIQNSIFGVDIQPVACQIAKLRFFISLAIEQEPDARAANFGIKPLPNLETRFVAANTLLGLDKPAQLSLGQTDTVTALQKQLNENRERHFHATTRREKLRRRDRDKALRNELAMALREADFPASDAEKLGRWDPYDQNESAEWFDPEYMFGIVDGFDVVTGNPPYIQLQRDGGKLARLYKNAGYQTFVRTGDIYQLFYEKAVELLKHDTGYVCFISSNQWMRVDSGRPLREFIEGQNPIQLVNLGASVFENVTVNTCIMLINRSSNKRILQAANLGPFAPHFPPMEWTSMSLKGGDTWMVLSKISQGVMDKMEARGTLLREWGVSIKRGIVTGYDSAFVIGEDTRHALIAEDPRSAEVIKPILKGKDIQRYQAQWGGQWLLFIPWHFPLHNDSSIRKASEKAERRFQDTYPAIYNYLLQHKQGLSARNQTETGKRYEWYALQRCANTYYGEFAKAKIVWGNLNNQARYSYAAKDVFVNAPSTILTPFNHYLLATLNSRLLDWYFRLIGVERDGMYYEYKPMFIRRLPIPAISSTKQRPFVRLVDSIMTGKSADPATDTSEQEAEIDHLVYDLYGLTVAEIAAVESG